uniref:C-type lectin domain family 2 member A-like n=1 Tax=Myodes glareolus TaxID=447135 RepID=UPI002020D039|nr:C-type lectin domain family 2 member A-like [Myodes glareolus]
MSEEITLTDSGDFQSTESREFQTRSRWRFYPSQVTSLLLMTVVFFLVIVALGATLAVEKQKSRTDPTPCLDDWIGYQQNCFHFFENTMTWGKSQNFCASHKATLAVFNITKEMDFLKRYADLSHYWIGLSREQGSEWQWADGTIYNSRLKIAGNGQYAYLHKNGIGSSSSHLFKKWICSK